MEPGGVGGRVRRRAGRLTELVPANELERVMARALVDPGAMPSFLAALARSEVVVPVFDAVEGELDPSVFRVVKHAGHEGVAAFTSTDQLRIAVPRGGPCVAVTGARLASGWDRRTSLLLNPGGTLGIALDWETVVSLSA